MDRELVEENLSKVFEETRKIINDAYVAGYKDGYFECMMHKHMSEEIESRPQEKTQLTLTTDI